jgi:hemerythrin-like domain-containing protein
MYLIDAFWQSYNEADSTLDAYFSDFVQANDLTKEQANAIRRDVIATLMEYFARMVEDIHQSEEADIVFEGFSPVGKIFDYFTNDCLQLDGNTKEYLRKSIKASAENFDNEDEDDKDDEDDDNYQVKKFLKAACQDNTRSPQRLH